ncbi:oxygen-insensitive NADPH nitroreductase [Glaesserella sp.]|uniref:oxygen-insensitive NADPH nitroreductase n=1 Tax=Glaesserella sp. TaxID=2094731 RepID=UPI0035A05BC6
MQSKPTLETILSHRSIRKFTSQPISSEILSSLIDAGRRASTSNNLQCVSIIRVTDQKIRECLRDASGMTYITECAEFLLFCIDFNKHKQLSPGAQIDWAEVSIIGAVDSGIMAQNVLLAAESLGLGGVFIGALRNNIQTVSDVLNLPESVIPLVGICLGYPAQDPLLKPRLPQALMCYENGYTPLDYDELAKYNQELTAYYEKRAGLRLNWQDNIKKVLNAPVRPHILGYFQQQGFLKK